LVGDGIDQQIETAFEPLLKAFTSAGALGTGQLQKIDINICIIFSQSIIINYYQLPASSVKQVTDAENGPAPMRVAASTRIRYAAWADNPARVA
jgi:hypothetical protein